MTDFIHRLIREGEHQRLDFKFEISDTKKIARTLVAFANTEGGRMLVGVKDNGAIAGIRSDEEIFMLQGAADLFCRPAVAFEARKWEINSKTILEVIIQPSNEKPHYAQDAEGKWLVYVRVKDQNILANRVLLKVWERKKQGCGTFVRYSHVEESLLRLLEERESISISAFCRLARVPNYLAEKVLVNLVSLSIIDMELSEKGALYRLNTQAFDQEEKKSGWD